MDKDTYQNITSPAETCISCGVRLDTFPRHRSALMAVSQQAVRRDICPACWDKMNAEEYFCHWLARREQKEPERRTSRREIGAMLLNLYEALQETEDEKYRTHLYVIAHLLMKMKVFKWISTRRPGDTADILVFQNQITKETLEIEDVELDDDALVDTKKEIDSLLASINR